MSGNDARGTLARSGQAASYRTHRPEFGGAPPLAWWRCACGANGYTTSGIRARQAWREHVRDTDRDSGISLADKGEWTQRPGRASTPPGRDPSDSTGGPT